MESTSDLPGAFVLEAAAVGTEVIASFTKIITSRKIQERQLENILATVSITTSLLTDLGTTINKYKNKVYIGGDVTGATCETCKADLEKLLVLSKEATEKGLWLREGTLGGKPVAAEVDPLFLFNVGLGGHKKSADFWMKLNATRYSLVALTDTVKYKIFKELNKQNRLDPEQAEEFKSLTALLPQLVKTIEKAEKIKKDRLAWEAAKAEKAEKALKSSRNRPDVGHKDESGVPVVERKDSDTASELTMIEPDLDLKKKETRFDIEDDRRSISTINSTDESNFVDIKEVFEEWMLRWNEPRKDIRKSRTVIGIKFKEYYEDPGFWGLDPELRSQTELKEAYGNLTANMSHAKYRASVDKIIRSLPSDAREEIEGLIEDRQKASCNEKFRRQWSVVAVRPKIKHHFGGEGFFKSLKNQDWLVMIKGETADRTDRKRPARWEDPWRKPYEPRRRYPRVIEDDYYDRDYPTRHNVRERLPPAQVHPLIPCPSPIPILEDRRHRLLTRDADIDGYRPGTIVVGDVANQEEAEKKMDEILDDLPGKFTI